MIKCRPIRYVFSSTHADRASDDARSYGYRLCSISLSELRARNAAVHVDVYTHVCPFLVRSFYAGTDRVVRAFAAEMEMEFHLDFMRQ